MRWLDDVTAHMGEPTSSSGGTNEHGSTCYVQWPGCAEVIVNNPGEARRFEVNIRSSIGGNFVQIKFGRTGEPTDAQMRDLCVLAGLLPLPGAVEAVAS